MGIRLAIGGPARSCGGRALGTELVHWSSRLHSPSTERCATPFVLLLDLSMSTSVVVL